MSNSNQILPFAIGTGANVLAPATWAATPAQSTGFQSGVAASVQVNTPLRQSAFVAAMIAQFTADFGPGNVLDNGNIPALEAQFEAALQQFIGQTFIRIVPQTTFFVDNTIGNNAFDGTTATPVSGTNHGPWATIQFAVDELALFNFDGQSVTLQLGTTGNYSGVLNINSPNSGTLIIQGSPSVQGTYTITGAPTGADKGVINVLSGSVELIGFIVQNTSSVTSSNAIVGANSTTSLQNVTMTATVAGTQAMISSGVGSVVNINPGCIFASSGSGLSWQTALFAQNGGTIAMNASAATFGTPSVTSAWALAQVLGVITVAAGEGISWIGTGATGPRFISQLNSVINTNGAGVNFFPGSTAGSTATGGQFD
jgi:hypothetical protein